MTRKHREVDRKKEIGLDIVLKCDSVGSVEAITRAISGMPLPESAVSIIHSGVGAVTKSDVLLAETASRLVVGFQVEVLPGLDRVLREHRVEVRLYDVIYVLTTDMRAVAESLSAPASQEEIIGSAKVIALFKGTRKGIIIGCEIMDGSFALGEHFRIISAMGPAYSGTIESMHIGKDAIQKAVKGQKVGIKIRDFSAASIGDIVETFRPLRQKARPWEPRGEIVRK